MRQIILASQSPRRKKLLEQIGLSFTTVPSNIEEKLNPRLKPKGQAEELSLEKAQTVAIKYPDAIIIAADTIIDSKGEILGKPRNMDDARRMIKKLQGKTHSVITGFTLLDNKLKKTHTDSVETKVTFRKLGDAEIKTYLKIEKPMDKAGGYGVQGIGAVLLEHIDGDFYNVVGLPLSKIIPSLKKFGVNVL
ncbi:MAG: septum formation inhibitor Maf [Candidatus Levybacteria bacterium]|nr:septum formation inhibitor Maf [Candidatus Levybacteria bacterium]